MNSAASLTAPVRVLLVDDDEDDFVFIRDLLSEAVASKHRLEWASSYEKAREQIARRAHDVYLIDYRLGEHTGLELIRESIAGGCKSPFIVLTGQGDQETDLQAMREGAADYLVKTQITAPLLERSIRYSLHRKQMDAQILVQDRLASVGLLASGLAHEIGTPLGVIRGRAEYLMIKSNDPEQIRKTAEIVVAQIDRVSKLIQSLLNLARGDASSRSGAVALERVIDDVLDLMRHEFERQGVRLELELPEGEISVTSEAEQLHQVVLNLLVNSLHAIATAVAKQKRPGGHFVRIAVSDAGNELWRLTVEDSGCGISTENMKNLFKPFFTTKDVGSGTGLGLANSYRIIESAGGSIEVQSEEGRGTRFDVLLPKRASVVKR